MQNYYPILAVLRINAAGLPLVMGLADNRQAATNLSVSDTFQVTLTKSCRGNEGVGNCDDPPPPGHDHNHNDGPGTGPGDPGNSHHQPRDNHGGGKGGKDRERDDSPSHSNNHDRDRPNTPPVGREEDDHRRGQDTVRNQWQTLDQRLAAHLAANDGGAPMGNILPGNGGNNTCFLGSSQPWSRDPLALNSSDNKGLNTILRGLQEGLRRLG